MALPLMNQFDAEGENEFQSAPDFDKSELNSTSTMALVEEVEVERMPRDTEASVNRGNSSAQSKRAGRKRSRSSDWMSELIEKIDKIGNAFERTADQITIFFKKEGERQERRLTLFNAIEQLGCFSTQEMFDVGEYISKYEHKLDIFFGLPDKYRKEYVLKQLNECNPYRPSYD